jgi:aminoglycoside phosphotransferase family enzyme/predicted kinase
MELSQLIAELSQPAAYSYPVPLIEVRQTHISVVFLAGSFVYKIKKPVDLGFLDFSSLEKRRHYCQEEVRLNRRLAPEVYLDVVPVTVGPSGARFEGRGDAIEWAVKMQRLPDDANMESRLDRGQLDTGNVADLAGRIAAFHAAAEGGERIAAFGRFDVVAGNARENLEQAAPHVGTTISRAVLDRLQSLVEASLEQNRALIEARADAGAPRDTHGDLRLDHVYLLPDRAPPADVIVIDCIEFNERFRFADPVADMAFLVMGFLGRGRGDLARTFADAYFRSSGDEAGRALLPFYVSYRAAVRGKVESLKLVEPEIPQAERDAALVRARGLWLLALSALEQPGRRPALVLVGGLPGSGKSTLAADLARQAGFTVIRSDVVRKELAGGLATSTSAAGFELGIYSPSWTERTYAECLRRAGELLLAGGRVIVDASFGDDRQRQAFLEAAFRLGVAGIFMLCHAPRDTIRERLGARRGDASDADWAIHLRAAETWQEPGPMARAALREISTVGSRQESLESALDALRDVQLLDR